MKFERKIEKHGGNKHGGKGVRIMKSIQSKLMKAARELSTRMQVKQADFDNSGEKLDEGFALIRAPQKLHESICKLSGLRPSSVELVFMCLKPEFAKERRYSLPHRHYKKSLTAVVPMSRGGTFLPSTQKGVLRLQEGECLIYGDKPHAFGMKEEGAFVAALAVANLEHNTAPIRQKDGSYRTSMLEVERYAGDTLHVLPA